MSFLKNLFGGSKKKKQFDKNFEKSIMKSCIATNSLAKIQANDLTLIRTYLEGKNGLTIEEGLKQFFQIIESGTFSIPARLKIMTTFHKYIIELGELFALEFLQFRFQNLLNHVPKKPKQILYHVVDVEDWVNENILTYYFNYLLRLANNYQIYKICIEEGQLPQTEDAKLDYKLKFMWLFKLSNIFSYILKMHQSFQRVFKDYPSYFLIQDIALLVLHDCVSYYNVMSKEIGDLVQTYPLLTTIDSIQFYQVYTELIGLTEQMNAFFIMKGRFDQFDYIIEPKWFYVTQKVHKEIENYSRKVELLHTSAANMRRTLKNGDNSSHQVRQGGGVNFTETAQYEKNRSKSAISYSKQPTKNVQNLPDPKLQQTQSHQINRVQHNEEEEDEEESQRYQQSNQNGQHNRMKTENVFSAAKQKKEEYIQDLQEEEVKAIKQYEELLKQQKSLNHEDEDPQYNNGNNQQHEHAFNNYQQGGQEEGDDEEEGEGGEENEEEQININLFNNNNNEDEVEDVFHDHEQNQQNQQQIINQMQEVINAQSNQIGQEICFSPGKPYTFRCEEPQSEEKNEQSTKKFINKQESEEVKDPSQQDQHPHYQSLHKEEAHNTHYQNNNHKHPEDHHHTTQHQKEKVLIVQEQEEDDDNDNQFQKDLESLEEAEKQEDEPQQNGIQGSEQKNLTNKTSSKGQIQEQVVLQQVDLNVSFS